jgi:gas vesicle protein
MKKILSIAIAVIVVGLPGIASAQTGPGCGTNDNFYNYSWSNYFNQSHSYSNDYNFLWGTNCLAYTNAPKLWSNYYQHSFSGPADAGLQVRNRFGKPELPNDVKNIVQQFTQDRQRLMNQLRTASDEQRQLILKEMEQLRTQLREQISQFREQAQQQAEQMRNRFGNNRDAILNQGAGSTGGGRDR